MRFSSVSVACSLGSEYSLQFSSILCKRGVPDYMSTGTYIFHSISSRGGELHRAVTVKVIS